MFSFFILSDRPLAGSGFRAGKKHVQSQEEPCSKPGRSTFKAGLYLAPLQGLPAGVTKGKGMLIYFI